MPCFSTSVERPQTPQLRDVSRLCKPQDSSAGPEEKSMTTEELDLKTFPLLKRFKILEKAKRVENERLILLQQSTARNTNSKADEDGSGRTDSKYLFSPYKKRKIVMSPDDERIELLFQRMMEREGFNTEVQSDIGAASNLPVSKWRSKLGERRYEEQNAQEEHMQKVFSKVSGKRSGITNRIHAPGRPVGECSKEAAPQARDTEDDGVVCDVCRSTDADPSNPIVFCDGCDLTVHASCYGNPLCNKVPDGDWFCEVCQSQGKSMPIQTCCLCMSSKGALKQTTDNRWAHISCALFVPEVFFRSPEARERIDCIQIPKRRWHMVCSLCKLKGGACVECTEAGCLHTFHVTCALERELALEIMEGKSGAVVLAFCESHTPRWEKLQESKDRRRYKIVPREPMPMKKKATSKLLARSKRGTR